MNRFVSAGKLSYGFVWSKVRIFLVSKCVRKVDTVILTYKQFHSLLLYKINCRTSELKLYKSVYHTPRSKHKNVYNLCSDPQKNYCRNNYIYIYIKCTLNTLGIEGEDFIYEVTKNCISVSVRK